MSEKKTGFGTFKGVYVPNMLGMFGVIMYMRLGFISAHLGVAGISAVIGIAVGIMAITALSVTSIVTNIRMGGGGAYYIISRSLGIKVGAALGMSMYLSQLISLSMCVAGFAISFHDLYPHLPVLYIEVATSTALLIIAYISSDLTLKAQIFIFVIIIASLLSVVSGSLEHVKETSKLAADSPVNFWSAFAIFFPAVTGIEAGMALSGDLKNPGRALSIGTFGALLTAALTYLGLAYFLLYAIPSDILINNQLALQEYASVKQLVLAGIWGATISCALGCVLGAPRILQAMAEDGVLPRFFAKTYGPRAEPRTALVLTYVGGLALVITTEIDQIIPILTMICLITYGMLNFVAGFADLIHHPSWRPSFKTPWPVSFAGSLACLMAMLMIDSGSTIVAFALVTSLYWWVSRKNLQAPFEDIRDTLYFYFSRKALYLLSPSLHKPKNWHLNILAFAPSPRSRLDFVYLMGALTSRTGLLSFTSFVPDSWSEGERVSSTARTLEVFFSKQSVPCVVEVSPNDNLLEGIKTYINSYGMGRLQPNTVALSSPRDLNNVATTVQVMREAVSAKKSFLLFRGHVDSGQSGGVFAATRRRAKRRLDVWWSNDDRNTFSFLLFLTNILKSAPNWRNIEVALRVASSDSASLEVQEKSLTEFLDERRLSLKPDFTVLETGMNAHFELAKRSKNSELVLIGLKAIRAEESNEQYEAYLADVLKVTADLSNVLFVLASEHVAFKEVFID